MRYISRLLCGAHRRAVLDEVKQPSGRQGSPVPPDQHAGGGGDVDLDFPLVLRAGPLCHHPGGGDGLTARQTIRAGAIIIFDPAGERPARRLPPRQPNPRSLLRDSRLDMDDPATHRFFASLFPLEETDREQIQKCRLLWTISRRRSGFRMIDDDTLDVVVPYGSSDEQAQVQAILGDMRAGRANLRVSMRRLQLYLVSIYRRQAEAYQERGLMTPVETVPGLGEWHGGYDPVRGLLTQGPAVDELVV